MNVFPNSETKIQITNVHLHLKCKEENQDLYNGILHKIINKQTFFC